MICRRGFPKARRAFRKLGECMACRNTSRRASLPVLCQVCLRCEVFSGRVPHHDMRLAEGLEACLDVKGQEKLAPIGLRNEYPASAGSFSLGHHTPSDTHILRTPPVPQDHHKRPDPHHWPKDTMDQKQNYCEEPVRTLPPFDPPTLSSLAGEGAVGMLASEIRWPAPRLAPSDGGPDVACASP